MNRLIKQCDSLLKPSGFSYAFCGGYAIELYLSKTVRAHGDIDISAFWEDRNDIIKFMQRIGWTVYEACGGGVIHLITDTANQMLLKCNIFCVMEGCPFFYVKHIGDDMYECNIEHTEQKELDYIEFLFNSKPDTDFIYARNTNVKRELNKAILNTDGAYYLSPELVLLYKSTDINRDGYQLDFDIIVSELSDDSRDWLKNALKTMYPDGHKWYNALLVL